MKTLPEHPNLEYLRREARTLKAKHRAKDKSVIEIIGHYDTSFHGLSEDEIFARKFSIIDAQRVTARQYCFASWRRIKLFIDKSSHKTDAFNPKLREQLLRRNKMRLALIRRAKDKRAGAWESLQAFNVESQDIVKNIYQQYGWPGPQIVGRDGTEACFWVAVSQSDNSRFQYETASLMKEALPKGECYGNLYACVIDRWLCLSYRPTLFGDFNDYNEESGCVECTSDVVDPDNLNKRRAEVGLPDFDSANRVLNQTAAEQKWPVDKKSDWQKMKRKWALAGGYIAE